MTTHGYPHGGQEVEGAGGDQKMKELFPLPYFPQLGPASGFPPCSNNTIKFRENSQDSDFSHWCH